MGWSGTFYSIPPFSLCNARSRIIQTFGPRFESGRLTVYNTTQRAPQLKTLVRRPLTRQRNGHHRTMQPRRKHMRHTSACTRRRARLPHRHDPPRGLPVVHDDVLHLDRDQKGAEHRHHRPCLLGHLERRERRRAAEAVEHEQREQRRVEYGADCAQYVFRGGRRFGGHLAFFKLVQVILFLWVCCSRTFHLYPSDIFFTYLIRCFFCTHMHRPRIMFTVSLKVYKKFTFRLRQNWPMVRRNPFN
jgi:hypothetical protein